MHHSPRQPNDRLRHVLLIVALGTSSVLGSLNASAATNGSTGYTSTGTVEIRLLVPAKVRISQLNDIALTALPGVDSGGSTSACIYRSGAGNYQITGVGSGSNGAFELADGSTTVPYQVSFNDAASSAQLSPGIALGGQVGADISSTDCATTGTNARIDVHIPEPVTQTLPSNIYSGTLTLVVAPD